MKKKKVDIALCGNGNTLCFGDAIENQSWFRLVIEWLEKNNVDIENSSIQLPSGKYAQPFKVENDWNWKIVEF